MNNLKLLLLLGAFLGFNNIVLSQNVIILDKKVIWIKSKKIKDSTINTDKLNLNFNNPLDKNDFPSSKKIRNVINTINMSVMSSHLQKALK